MREMEAWAKRASNRAFWLNLCPWMHIGQSMAEPVIEVDKSLLSELRNAFLVEGYFQFPSVLPMEVIGRMRRCVEALHEKRIPLGFCYMYDEFWYLTQWVDQVLVGILGKGYRRLPDHWAWYVEPGSRGWSPHRDKDESTIMPGGYPKSVSIWVPLTDATPLNGCMYVVPANLDPNYRSEECINEVEDLQTVRALPAKAGSVLMWNQALLHWGAASRADAPEPRVSFSIEYQRGDFIAYNRPLINPSKPPPTFEHRLGLAGKQILQYEHMFAPHGEIVELGRRLRALNPIMDVHDPGPLPPGIEPGEAEEWAEAEAAWEATVEGEAQAAVTALDAAREAAEESAEESAEEPAGPDVLAEPASDPSDAADAATARE